MVIENDTCKILWDFILQTDHFMTERRPRVIVIDKEHHEYRIIDYAIPYDKSVDDKEVEKIEENLDLVRELKKVRFMKMSVVPLVVVALGTPTKSLEKRL